MFHTCCFSALNGSDVQRVVPSFYCREHKVRGSRLGAEERESFRIRKGTTLSSSTPTSSSMAWLHRLWWLVVATIQLLYVHGQEEAVNDSISCTTDEDCVTSSLFSSLLSICHPIDKVCTTPHVNPLEKGCFHGKLPNWNKIRVCNSDDPPHASQLGICRDISSNLDYLEIRIKCQVRNESRSFCLFIGVVVILMLMIQTNVFCAWVLCVSLYVLTGLVS